MTPECTADTSVVIPALSDWHEHHAIAQRAIADVHRLPGHVMSEAYSVLTRLPKGLAISPAKALEGLRRAFPDMPLVLAADHYGDVLAQLSSAGICGGATYDGLVGATAARAGVELATLDGRAAATYRAVGVRLRLVE